MLHYKTFVTRNILFKFKATFSHVNKRFPVQWENSIEWKSAFRSGSVWINKLFEMTNQEF